MPIVDLRPNGTSSSAGGAWTAQPSGTLHGVTSDDNDATYARSPANNFGMSLNLTDNPLGADERLRRLRVRVRCQRDDPSVSLPSVPIRGHVSWAGQGSIAELISTAPTTIVTRSGPWFDAFIAEPNDHRINTALIAVNRNTLEGTRRWRAMELWVRLDIRSRPAVNDVEVREVEGGPNEPNITAVQQPWLAAKLNYGYAGMEPETSRYRLRVFHAADTIVPGFDPWSSEALDLAVFDIQPAVNITTPLSAHEIELRMPDALEDGTYRVYWQMRALGYWDGIWDSDDIQDESWMQFTVNYVPPSPPSIDCQVDQDNQLINIEVEHEPSTSGTDWNDPDDVRVQLQRRVNGGSWVDAFVDGQGQIVPEGEARVLVDRFVPRSYCGEDCQGEPPTYEVEYRARLYGVVIDDVVVTDWAVCEPLVLCTDQQAWLRHPTDADLDLAFCSAPDTWTVTRRFEPMFPVRGGRPTVASSAPAGRDKTLSIAARNTPELNSLEEILKSLQLFYQPEDYYLKEQWLAIEPYSVTNSRVPITGFGSAWLINLPTTEVGSPPASIPPVT